MRETRERMQERREQNTNKTKKDAQPGSQTGSRRAKGENKKGELTTERLGKAHNL